MNLYFQRLCWQCVKNKQLFTVPLWRLLLVITFPGGAWGRGSPVLAVAIAGTEVMFLWPVWSNLVNPQLTAVGVGLWWQEQRAAEAECRVDWHQTGPTVCLSIFAKTAEPEKSYFEANKVTLKVFVVFGKGSSVFQKTFNLRDVSVLTVNTTVDVIVDVRLWRKSCDHTSDVCVAVWYVNVSVSVTTLLVSLVWCQCVTVNILVTSVSYVTVTTHCMSVRCDGHCDDAVPVHRCEWLWSACHKSSSLWWFELKVWHAFPTCSSLPPSCGNKAFIICIMIISIKLCSHCVQWLESFSWSK